MEKVIIHKGMQIINPPTVTMKANEPFKNPPTNGTNPKRSINGENSKQNPTIIIKNETPLTIKVNFLLSLVFSSKIYSFVNVFSYKKLISVIGARY